MAARGISFIHQPSDYFYLVSVDGSASACMVADQYRRDIRTVVEESGSGMMSTGQLLQ